MEKLDKVRRHFQAVDSLLYPYVAQVDYEKWCKKSKPQGSSQFYFSRLCEDIIGQQLSGKAADTIIGRFKVLIGYTLTPQRVLLVPDQDLRHVGLSWAKVKYVKNIAEAFIDGGIDAQRLHGWNDEAIITHLTAIKGVGRWTAEMFLIFTLGRPNVFSHGDLGLKRGIEKLYGFKNPTKEKVDQLISPWSPYKTYGSLALWHCLDNR